MQHKFPYKWYLKDGYPEKNGYKVFSCFACGGGSTMGYKLAGFEVLGANEIDLKMAECYKVNHNPKHLFIEPIQEFKKRKDLPVELYDLDILDGSPPCSSFSMAGNREKDWSKEKKFREGQSVQVLDTLFFDFIDLGKRLQPKIIIAENVKGLLMGVAKEYVWRIYQAFDEAGYYVHKWLLDASRMGVPQRRERVFFVAIRKDLVSKIDCTWKVDLFNPMPHLDMEFDEKEIYLKDFLVEQIPLRETQNYSKVRFGDIICLKNRSLPTIVTINRYFIDKKNLICDKTKKLGGSYPLDYDFRDNVVQYLIGMSVPPIMTAQIATRIKEQWFDRMSL